MGTTANRAYRYPGSGDDVRPYEDIQFLAQDVDADVQAIITARDAAWTNYTPTWLASGGTPAIGNGTIAGRYKQIGKTVFFSIYVLFGSTTSFSSGAYSFSLPVAAVTPGSPAGSLARIGSAYLRDASGTSTGHYTGMTFVGPGATTVGVFEASAHAQLQAGVPVVWANTDFFHITGTYEAA